jgi:NAD(P)-dependent dehydrogenase (short-subunit alcohol dehydrogenase family)
MTTPQHKIGSGFGATTTAAEAVDGANLTGKLAIVTGGYSGIGLETTRVLAGAGARVVVPARRPDQARAAVGDGVEVAELDLGDLGSVRDFAARFLDSGRRIDIVVTSAGIMAAPETRVGPGWEAQFAVDHLGHYALVGLLWPAVGPGARIVSVSSRGHHYSGMRWDDVHFTRGGYDKWLAYGQAKTANALFAVHLDDADRGVRAFSLHPGRIPTNLVRYLEPAELVAAGMTNEAGEVIGNVKTIEQGAATQVWAATAPRLAGLGGVYLEDCEVAEPAPADGTRVGVKAYAADPAEAARLWALSAELTGIDPLD